MIIFWISVGFLSLFCDVYNIEWIFGWIYIIFVVWWKNNELEYTCQSSRFLCVGDPLLLYFFCLLCIYCFICTYNKFLFLDKYCSGKNWIMFILFFLWYWLSVEYVWLRLIEFDAQIFFFSLYSSAWFD